MINTYGTFGHEAIMSQLIMHNLQETAHDGFSAIYFIDANGVLTSFKNGF